MATSLSDLAAVVAAQRESGRTYMMMETAVYTRQFLYAQELKRRGDFGRIQFLRGAHYQDMERWPPYWNGLPPMWYATHAIAPLLAIAETRAARVHCFGSGEMREELRRQYSNPYPVETAVFQLEAPGLAAEVTRSLFHCARYYMESFVVYGENACYEWQMEDEPPVLMRMSPVVPGEVRRQDPVTRPELQDRVELLRHRSLGIRAASSHGQDERHLSFEQGGGVPRLTSLSGPRVRAQRRRGTLAPNRCGHGGKLDGGRDLRPSVGDGGWA